MLSMVGLEAKIMKKRTILKVKYDKMEYSTEERVICYIRKQYTFTFIFLVNFNA